MEFCAVSLSSPDALFWLAFGQSTTNNLTWAVPVKRCANGYASAEQRSTEVSRNNSAMTCSGRGHSMVVGDCCTVCVSGARASAWGGCETPLALSGDSLHRIACKIPIACSWATIGSRVVDSAMARDGVSSRVLSAAASTRPSRKLNGNRIASVVMRPSSG